MDIDIIKRLLEDYKAGEVSINNVLGKIKELPYQDIAFAKGDTHPKIPLKVGSILQIEPDILNRILGLNKYQPCKMPNV